MSMLNNKSNKFGAIVLSLVLIFFMSCSDPCKILAEKICECKETASERKECYEDAKLAGSHKGYEKAYGPKLCEEALENCTCRDINEGRRKKCGFYRYNRPNQ